MSWLFRHKSATFQYILWTLPLVRFIIPPTLPSLPWFQSVIPPINSEMMLQPIIAGNGSETVSTISGQESILLFWIVTVVADAIQQFRQK
jgi:hypothetical protein